MVMQHQQVANRVDLVKERLSFLVQYLRNPKEVGALLPSGSPLANIMTREIASNLGPVLELGPGTGSFTRAILARGIKPQDLTMVETNSEFCTLLQRDFPGAHVHCMNAADISKQDLFDGRKVGAVVSGVPFLLLQPSEAKAILKAVFEVMHPDAALYQVTYGFTAPFPREVLKALDLVATHAGRTLRNAPPASCYRLKRRSSSAPRH
jgi:phosphatidylethanolamine/phosphatidyl-N-methylethanolamine N-methyltransferase